LLTNAQLSELLAVAAEGEEGHRQTALARAARSAYFWPEEAMELVDQNRSLTELRNVGPWVAQLLDSWLAADSPPEPLEPPELRRGFMTLSEARSILATAPDWVAELRGDLQMHTTYSDGKATLREMAAACEGRGYRFMLTTDHSKGLPIAHGMDEEGFAGQAEDIAALNDELTAVRSGLRVLQGIEMNLGLEGEGDMDPWCLARLALVLGAFHSKLRRPDDQTSRAMAAVRNRLVHVLAHPRGRRFNVRMGVRADWPRVIETAAAEGIALEFDASPDRQDLDTELMEVAREAGVWLSIGTDAHSVGELDYMQYGLAAAVKARIPRDRILNFMDPDQLLKWAAERRGNARV